MRELSKTLSVLTVLGMLSVFALSSAAVTPGGGGSEHDPNMLQPVGVIEIEQNSAPGIFVSHGSGVFITPTKFLTAEHVITSLVDNRLELSGRVRMEDGTLRQVTNVAVSRKYDLAIVTVDTPYEGYIPPVSCKEMPRGAELITIGNPLSMEFVEVRVRVTGGKFSPGAMKAMQQQQSAEPSADKPERKAPDNIQPPPEKPKEPKPVNFNGTEFFQGVALPGQSGSPVFTPTGEVVGILTITVTDQSSFTGLGLYVKTSAACGFLTGLTQ